ncbi:MAG: dihydrodipicolinate synthase family protein [Verrucomicrobiota bacterium]
MREEPFEPKGVIPACLLPFDSALEIDEGSYRKHLQNLAGVDGVSAVTVNGHAAEVHALNFDEQQKALGIACEEIGEAVPIVAGIHTTNSRKAARLAKMSENEGASALLVFPNEVLSLGGEMRPECARAHLSEIAAAAQLPLILFQYPRHTGLAYSLDELLAICHEFPTVRAIKDWCNDVPLHERHLRELHGLARPVSVLSTHSMWLFSSLVLGCDGILSGAGSVIAALQVALFRAVRSGQLEEARALNDRIYPTVQAFYADPLFDMHNRMKEALVLLGRLDEAHVRPPLVKLEHLEIERIAGLLAAAGIDS